MLLWANDFCSVFWVAVVPAFAAVALLYFGIREEEKPSDTARTNPIRRENIVRMPSAYWWVVGLGAVFTLARFSEAFLVLKAQETGIPVAMVPLVMVAMSVVYSATAYPFGKLSDSVSHNKLLGWGLVMLIGANLLLAHGGLVSVFAGVGLWGVHMGMTQGLLAAMVADTAPSDLRGSAYGVFNLASGFAMLLASVVAGIVWERFGSFATFYVGAAFSLLSLTLIAVTPSSQSRKLPSR